MEKRLIVANAVRPFKEGNALANRDTLNQPSFSIKYAIKRLEGIKKSSQNRCTLVFDLRGTVSLSMVLV